MGRSRATIFHDQGLAKAETKKRWKYLDLRDVASTERISVALLYGLIQVGFNLSRLDFCGCRF